MAVEWFYESGGEQCGPVSSSELKSLAISGIISPETLVWREGYEDWVCANSAQGLFSKPSSARPPRLSPPSTKKWTTGSDFDSRLFAGVVVFITVLWGLLYNLLGSLGNATIGLVSVVTVILVLSTIHLMLCKARAIASQKNEQPVLFNLIKLVLWAPNEGFILLRNKQIKEVIHGDGGGIRFIFPMFGEEIAARVSLGVQLTHFEDDHFLTRESVQVRLRAAIWWHVVDLEKYYFLMNSGIGVVTEEGGRKHSGRESYGRKNTAEGWIQALAESSLRQLISQANYSALVSATASNQLKAEHNGSVVSDVPHSVTPDFISERLRRELLPKVQQYGLELNRVEIQDVALDPKLQEAITQVWTASLKPAQSEAEARAKQIELEAVVNVLGVNAVAMNEVAKNFQNANYVGSMPNVLGAFLGEGDTKPNSKKRLTNKPKSEKESQPE